MSENVSANIDATPAAPTRRRRGVFIALGLAVAAAAIGGYFWFSKNGFAAALTGRVHQTVYSEFAQTRRSDRKRVA